MRSPDQRAGPPRIVYLYLAVIVLSWAGNWPLMRLAIDDVAPFVFVLLRVVGAVIVLAPVFHALRMPLLPIPGERLGLFWVGQLQVTGFLLVAVSVPVVMVFALPQLVEEPIHWSAGLIAILAYNWIVTTALGYFLWALVLTAMPATTAGQVLALTPVGGFLLSTAIFGGAVTADVVASIGLIVAGIILTLRSS